MKYKAIIWDCDGVLIDSEVLSCTAAVEILAELGYKITLEKYLNDFMGKSTAQMFSDIEAETGLQLQKNFPDATLQQRQKDIFTQHLKATEGMAETLKQLTIPMAIASGSSSARLEHTLKITQLFDFFKDHIYSAEMVKNGKPAPDVFLYAADKLGVNPADCLVIEDSIHGVHGAKAAGMDVFAFMGGSHMNPHLRQNLLNADVQAVLHRMDELLPLLAPSIKMAG